MRSFIHRNLDPVGRLGEILFGLIMALGFTGSVRLGLEEADNRSLFVGILGCNLAWAIVDGAMYVMAELFDRGRRARLIREVRSAPDETRAIELIAAELDEKLEFLESAPDRGPIHRAILEILRSGTPVHAKLRREDLLGGVAAGLVIVLATLPVVVPFLVVPDPNVAVRVSNAVALSLVFLLGTSWARVVGGRPLVVGLSLTAVGVVLVLITIALGG